MNLEHWSVIWTTLQFLIANSFHFVLIISIGVFPKDLAPSFMWLHNDTDFYLKSQKKKSQAHSFTHRSEMKVKKKKIQTFTSCKQPASLCLNVPQDFQKYFGWQFFFSLTVLKCFKTNKNSIRCLRKNII